MAQDTTLNGPGGLRAQMIHSFYGRKDGLDINEFNVGPKDIRVNVEGFVSQTTLLSTVGASVGSTGYKLANYGVSLVGSTIAAGTTVYVLDPPVPGVYKTLFNPSTGSVVVFSAPLTTGGPTPTGPFFISTASVTSTHQTCTFTGKGNSVQLIGVTTNLWGVLQTQTISTVTTGTVFFS